MSHKRRDPGGQAGAGTAVCAGTPQHYTTAPCPLGHRGRYYPDRERFECSVCNSARGRNDYERHHAAVRELEALRELLAGDPFCRQLYEARREFRILRHRLTEAEAARDALRALVVQAARGEGIWAGGEA